MANPEQKTLEEQMNLFKEEQRKREVLMRTNSVSLAGVVIDLKMLPQAPKTDKQGNIILDDNQNPTFFEEKWWCSIGVVGSEEGVLLSSELAQNIQIDNTYLFEGRLKNRKFSCSTVTQL